MSPAVASPALCRPELRPAGWRRVGFVLVSLVALAAGSPALAQDGHAWRFGNAGALVTASVFSTNTLDAGSTRAIDYHPTLTIACNPQGEPKWTQWIRVRTPASGGEAIDMSVRLDGGAAQSEQWALVSRNRSFSRDGSEAVARLAQARRVTLGWRFGFLSGQSVADFNLSGAGEAIAKLAAKCGVSPP